MLTLKYSYEWYKIIRTNPDSQHLYLQALFQSSLLAFILEAYKVE